MPDITIEKLSRQHDREAFDCDIKELNEYLKKYALQNSRKNFSQTYVLTDSAKSILGYFSLSTASIKPNIIPSGFRLPNYAIPAALIGRLAVAKEFQGKKYGSLLLMDALKKIVNLSDKAGLFCITVDAKDDSAKKFYKKFGFEELLDDTYHLFMSIKKVKKVIGDYVQETSCKVQGSFYSI